MTSWTLLLGLIGSAIGNEPFLVIGHSYGGYLARAIADLRPDQAVGLALICPVGAQTRDAPKHRVLVSSAGPDRRAGPGSRGYLPQLLRCADGRKSAPVPGSCGSLSVTR